MGIIVVSAEVDIDDVVEDVFNYLPDNEIFERIKADALFQETVRRMSHMFQHFFDYFEGDMPLMNSVDFARLKGAVDKEQERRLSLESKCVEAAAAREVFKSGVEQIMSDINDENGV